MSGQAQVTREDQERINQFNRLHTKVTDLEAQIKAQKKILEELDDASSELMLSDDESVRFLIGECWVHLAKEEAEERIDAMAGSVRKEVDTTNTEIADLNVKIKELKALLYAKFGSNINLDP